MSHKKAAQEWETLGNAIATIPPPGTNDTRFTDDEPPAVLASICARCPILAPCRTYAEKAKPLAGYWAGHHYGTISRETTNKTGKAA